MGFYKGFAVGQSKDQKENWLIHCYGALGMGRANEIDSGGTELYVVIGHAQRYLDKNVTVFGRVIYGMEHLQALKRNTSNGKKSQLRQRSNQVATLYPLFTHQ